MFNYLNLVPLQYREKYCTKLIADAEELRLALIMELPFDDKGRLIKDQVDTGYLRKFEKDVYETARLQDKIYHFNVPQSIDWARTWRI